MVVCMKRLSKLLGRPGESREDEAARGSKVLRGTSRCSQADRPQSEEPTPPIAPSAPFGTTGVQPTASRAGYAARQ